MDGAGPVGVAGPDVGAGVGRGVVVDGAATGRVTDDPVAGAFGVPEARGVVGHAVGVAVRDERLAVRAAAVDEGVVDDPAATIDRRRRSAGVEVAHRRGPADRAQGVAEGERLAQALVHPEGAELGRIAAADRRHLVRGEIEAAERGGRVGLQLATEGSVADRPLDDCSELLAGHGSFLSSPFVLRHRLRWAAGCGDSPGHAQSVLSVTFGRYSSSATSTGSTGLGRVPQAR